VIPVAARWYVRYDAPYRDVKKLLAEGGITVDHVTIYRWVHAALLKQLSRTDARAFTNALQKLTRLATGRVRTHPFEQAHHAGGETVRLICARIGAMSGRRWHRGSRPLSKA